jgi:glycosyltransferase involved in cell wall biosynthesis
MVEKHLVSVIVPSYTMRRLGDIFELIKSIKAQTYPYIEAIIVVERSKQLLDSIKDYAERNGNTRLKIVLSDKPGATSARNSGINLAEGEYLAFIDDDARLSQDWAAELVKTYHDESVAGVTGTILPLWEDGAERWFPAELDWIIGCSRWLSGDGIKETRSVLGTNASFRKDALKLAGSYSSALGARKSRQSEWGVIAEEAELSLRVKQNTGKRIVHNPELVVHHRVAGYKLRWGFIAQRSYQVGRTRWLIKSLGTETGHEAGTLGTEYRLLRRILAGLIPRTLLLFLRNPVRAWRRLSVTVLALFFVALGYFSQALSAAGDRRKLLVQQEGVE